ncbi:MAG: extracellular solute-binding protein [Deltaproteobacteria bacterium]|nr:extracellular solute-binding protein [Deltaproteobacteria bacterium]
MRIQLGCFGKVVTSFLLMLAWIPAASADETGARKEGKVIVYGSLETGTVNILKKGFKEKHGVDLEYWWGSSTKVTDRITTEFRAGKQLFDVTLNHRPLLKIMKKEGIIGNYESPALKFFPPEVIDKEVGPAYRNVIIGIIYNEAYIKPDQAPKSYDDLLDSKWKGKFVMADPSRHTTTTQWLASLHKIMGKEKAPKYIRGLAAQRPVLAESITPASQKILTGEVPIGFAFTKYVVIYGKEGAKLDYVKVDKMLGDGQYFGISSKPPHPNAARLFIDYFLSEEGMRILADVGETVTRKGIYPALKDAEKIKFLEVDELDKKGFAEKTQEYRKIFFQ